MAFDLYRWPVAIMVDISRCTPLYLEGDMPVSPPRGGVPLLTGTVPLARDQERFIRNAAGSLMENAEGCMKWALAVSLSGL